MEPHDLSLAVLLTCRFVALAAFLPQRDRVDSRWHGEYGEDIEAQLFSGLSVGGGHVSTLVTIHGTSVGAGDESPECPLEG